MPQSLQDLKRLSEDEQLHRYVRELEFGPEILNTNLEVDLQYIKEQGRSLLPVIHILRATFTWILPAQFGR